MMVSGPSQHLAEEGWRQVNGPQHLPGHQPLEVISCRVEKDMQGKRSQCPGGSLHSGHSHDGQLEPQVFPLPAELVTHRAPIYPSNPVHHLGVYQMCARGRGIPVVTTVAPAS